MHLPIFSNQAVRADQSLGVVVVVSFEVHLRESDDDMSFVFARNLPVLVRGRPRNRLNVRTNLLSVVVAVTRLVHLGKYNQLGSFSCRFSRHPELVLHILHLCVHFRFILNRGRLIPCEICRKPPPRVSLLSSGKGFPALRHLGGRYPPANLWASTQQ
jgi:hypothetical protein